MQEWNSEEDRIRDQEILRENQDLRRDNPLVWWASAVTLGVLVGAVAGIILAGTWRVIRWLL